MPKIKGWISWFIRYNPCKVCLSFSHKLWPKFGNRWISRVGSVRFWWNSVQRKALIPTICSREIFTKKCWQQQNFDSDPKEAWHYNHVTFTPIAKNFMLYCRLIKMLSMLYVRLLIKVKVRTPENFKVGWYPHKITFQGRVTLIASHLAPLWNRLEQRNSETTHLRDTNKRQGAHIHEPLAWPVL